MMSYSVMVKYWSMIRHNLEFWKNPAFLLTAAKAEKEAEYCLV